MVNNISPDLQAFGLSENETLIYLELLQNSPQTAVELSRKLPINRTTIYRQIEHLNHLGLVQENLGHKTTRYSASSPEKLELVLNNKQTELNSLRLSFSSVLTSLQQYQQNSNSPTKILYYHGVDGLKQILYNTLSATTEIVGYGYQNWNTSVGEKYAEFLRQEYTLRHLHSREILNHLPPFTPNQKYLHQSYSHRLIPPSQLTITHDTYIYNNVTTFYHTLHSEHFAVEIYNQDISHTQAQIFNLLWQIAQPPA